MKLFSKRLLLKLTLSTLFFLFTNLGVAFSSSQLDYVALGDSLAAGWTPNDTIDTSYPDYIAEKLDSEGALSDYNNYGVPGFTTDNVLKIINPTVPENADTIMAISKAEIITLDIGANDLLGLIPTLTSDPSQASAAIGSVIGNIAQILGTLKAINPNAKIYLMGYYNAFYGFPLTAEEKAALADLIGQFNSVLEQLANISAVTYIDTYTIIDKNPDKYLPEANIHPTVFGYRAIAKEFWSIIKVDFLRGIN